jgi:GNAT superfamily N-acetyltransferase
MAHSDAARLIERELAGGDVAAALRLSTAAQWNQTAADWTYLTTAGNAFGLSTPAGELIATALALPYALDFGWISMVIVDPAFRDRGLAKRLMQRCIDTLATGERTPVLDATPAGRAVYQRLGFVAAWDYQRLRRIVAGAPIDVVLPAGLTLRALAAADLRDVAAFDRTAFGSPREGLLRALHARLPQAAWIVHDGEAIRGYCLGREGRTAQQIGPVIATHEALAIKLVANALAKLDGPVIADVPDQHVMFCSALERAGFAPERTLTRMVYRRPLAFGDRALTFALAGPELG